MTPFTIAVRSTVTHVSRFGRFTDLAVALITLGLGIWWSNFWLIGGSAIGFLAFAFNLNAHVQRVAMNWAFRSASKRRR